MLLAVVDVAVVSIGTTIVAVVAAAAATEADAMTIVVALGTTLTIAVSMVADVTAKKDMDLETLIATQPLPVMTATVVVAMTDVVVVAAVAAATMIVATNEVDTMLLLVGMNLVTPTVGGVVVVVEITALVRTVTPDKFGLSLPKAKYGCDVSTYTFILTLPRWSLERHDYFRFNSCIPKACSLCLVGDVSKNPASAMTN